MPPLPNPTSTRPIHPRLWRNLAAGAAAVSLAGVPALADGAHDPVGAAQDMGARLWLAQGEGGEGGEAGAVAEAPADVAYLAQLMIVEGHLVAALDLYRKGQRDEAVGLSWHPEAEMMDEVRAALATHGAADVTPAMAAFSAAMEAEASLPEVEAALAKAQAAFAAAAAAGSPAPRLRADALVLLVRAAAHEYDESIEAGAVADPFAYHEAHAFATVARDQLQALAAIPGAEAQATKALTALAGAGEAFGDMTGTALEAKDPAILLAVAARVELALSSVR